MPLTRKQVREEKRSTDSDRNVERSNQNNPERELDADIAPGSTSPHDESKNDDMNEGASELRAEFEDYSVDTRPSITILREFHPHVGTSIQAEITAADQKMEKVSKPSGSAMEMLDHLRNLRAEYDKVRAEMKTNSERLNEVERRVEKLPDFVLDKIQESEDRTHDEITDQVSSLRNMNEIRFKIMEGRLTQAKEEHDLTEKAAELNASSISMCESIARQNTSDIQKIDGKQALVERKLLRLEKDFAGNPGESPSINALRLTPKQPVFNETSQPVKFLEELRDFWEAVRPSRHQLAFVIGSCLRGTAKDWWDLTKEEDDDFDTFCEKFMERYWGESVQHEAKSRLEFGFYHTGSEIGMATYALQAFREARSLTPPLRDGEIILKLARHFNEDIRSMIIGRSISCLKDLLNILEKFDRCGPLNSQRAEAATPKENWKSRQIVQGPDRSNQYRRSNPPQQRFLREEGWKNNEKPPVWKPREVRSLDISEEPTEERGQFNLLTHDENIQGN